MTKRVTMGEAQQILAASDADMAWLRDQGFLPVDKALTVDEALVRSVLSDLPRLRLRMREVTPEESEQSVAAAALLDHLRIAGALLLLGSIASPALLDSSAFFPRMAMIGCAGGLAVVAVASLVISLQQRRRRHRS